MLVLPVFLPRLTLWGHRGFGTGIVAKVGLPVKPTLSMPFSQHPAAFLQSISLVFMDTAQGTRSAGGRHRARAQHRLQWAMRCWVFGHHHPKVSVSSGNPAWSQRGKHYG